MASLKEVRTRINSIKSTRKITSAMKMVASSKLHRAQQAIGNMRPYEKHLFEIMSGFLSKLENNIETRYSETREVRKVAIVAISSNSSLCGAFNTNVIKELKNTAAEYRAKGCEVEVYPIGRKVADAARKMGFKFESDHSALLEHPEYGSATILSEKLMTRFSIGEIDKVILIYQHFASTSRQEMRAETFLPINLQEIGTDSKAAERKGKQLDFIIEPSVQSIVESLIPTSLHFKIFTALLDSLAAEHSARVMAMQVATDNADELIEQLTLAYNKARQQAITSELLDIMGGSMQ